VTYDELMATLKSWRGRPVFVAAGRADSYVVNVSGRIGAVESVRIPADGTEDAVQFDTVHLADPGTRILLSPAAFESAKLDVDVLTIRSDGFVVAISRYPKHLHDQPA
jgi:hypothetical protein